jgi:hypothetical protein
MSENNTFSMSIEKLLCDKVFQLDFPVDFSLHAAMHTKRKVIGNLQIREKNTQTQSLEQSKFKMKTFSIEQRV